MKIAALLYMALFVLSLACAACGGTDEPPPPDRSTTIPADCGGGITCR